MSNKLKKTNEWWHSHLEKERAEKQELINTLKAYIHLIDEGYGHHINTDIAKQHLENMEVN